MIQDIKKSLKILIGIWKTIEVCLKFNENPPLSPHHSTCMPYAREKQKKKKNRKKQELRPSGGIMI